ncbi:MAG: hypothetical protein QXG65_00640, partial [Thermoplasmata archaeon]
RKEGFEKTGIFTDRVDWMDEQIVRRYYARSGMEEEFHVLKDVLLMPIFYRLDKRIRVHALRCGVGLLFYRWIQRRVEAATKGSIPIGQLASRLGWIPVVALARPGSKKVKVVLQKLDRERSAKVKALGPARFVPH